ncbi:MAG TPA: hypothetical protein VJS64_16980 [Pyrinomonadaceae bacterium]|nr:hypothetical protein [Pyrinomonadaceae bacterium]
MKKPYLLLAAVLLIASLASVASAAGNVADDSSEFTPLNNKDILLMVQQHVETEAIVKAIKVSPCTFDTFPPVLREMKRRGVPEAVLKAMVDAPYGPSVQASSRDDLGEQPIYHYAEQLKQLGFLAPLSSGRGLPTRQARARGSSRTRQAY